MGEGGEFTGEGEGGYLKEVTSTPEIAALISNAAKSSSLLLLNLGEVLRASAYDLDGNFGRDVVRVVTGTEGIVGRVAGGVFVDFS